MSFDGSKLKQARIKAGVSVQDISDILEAKGIRAKKNTIYSWENGNSQPAPDALLTMCEKYHITDPLDYFGYHNEILSNKLSYQEVDLALAYRRASDDDRIAVEAVLRKYREEKDEALPQNEEALNIG